MYTSRVQSCPRGVSTNLDVYSAVRTCLCSVYRHVCVIERSAGGTRLHVTRCANPNSHTVLLSCLSIAAPVTFTNIFKQEYVVVCTLIILNWCSWNFAPLVNATSCTCAEISAHTSTVCHASLFAEIETSTIFRSTVYHCSYRCSRISTAVHWVGILRPLNTSNVQQHEQR